MTPNPLKIAFMTTIPNDALPFIGAVNTVNAKSNIVSSCVQSVAHARDFRDFGNIEDFIHFAQTSHIVLVHLMGSSGEVDRLIAQMKTAGVPCFVSSASPARNRELAKLCTVEPQDYQIILKYLNFGGKNNMANLLLYLANRFTGTSYKVVAPEAPQWEGIYHPDLNYFPTLDDYAQKKLVAGKVTVGLWFNQNHLQGGNTVFVNSLIREIESQGANVIPLFFRGVKDDNLGTKGLEWLVNNYYIKDGKPLVDVVINALSFSLPLNLTTAEASCAFLKRLGVPILKAVLTCNTFTEWQNSLQGLNPVDICRCIALPEFDGDIITVPIAAMEFTETDVTTGAKIIKFQPIPERVNKLVRLSLKWAKLRYTPNKEKKVAIILHNYPPRNDTVGHAFGLDTPASVLNILKRLDAAGYSLKELPGTPQSLIETILDGLTNDRRWLSNQDLAERAVAKISAKQYTEWFKELPSSTQKAMEQAWGQPPGEIFSHKGDLLVAGIVNGNVFVGLQPPRGFSDDPASIYHSPDLAMPHHYYAYYKWIRDVFKADVIMHVGTHGTLEWLPGKSVGLSDACFPDVTISDLPHIYHYIISNPGEGTQAKRRSYSCIIDHLVPVMNNADSYGELAELEVMLRDYYHAKTYDKEKLPHMQKLIWENVCKAKIDKDLEVTQEAAFADFDEFLEGLHSYIHELSDTQIRDGIHILGEAPTGQQLNNFLCSLTRLSNGAVPSLRQSIAELKGYDYDDLLANKGKLRAEGKTNGDLLNEISELSLELLKQFNLANFKEQNISIIIQNVLGKPCSKVQQCLSYVSGFLVPALAATTDELTNTLSACEGNYVPSGPSGSPTRGMCDVLPTGRNFYSVDPRAVPSMVAWRVGVSMGDTLLERYLKDEGKYPENVGMVVWATDNMRSKGDDVAEILYLMGTKPVWEKTSGRVTGVEVIPVEQLKHPRIDVTVRISGLFRDTFPDVVSLLDDAVRLVSGLTEPADKNYLAKHVLSEVEKRVVQGENAETVREEASYRIFGARPGTYGCGVNEAIDSKNWKDQKDLANIYVTWGGYAYGRNNFGKSAPDQFKHRLGNVNLTVKNDNTREYDILDSDDWYDAHGGMISAVKTFKGEAPNSYCGDSSDPDRVKVRSTAEETKHVFRSRLLNPKYIESMKRHNYHGAADLSRSMDFVFGWDATVEAVDDWMYEDLAKKYVLDPEMQRWFKEVNPYALQNMTERLLEAIKRGMWQASDDMKKQLQQLYLNIEGLLEGENDKQ
ncbi:MAG: cobaltochelatase subunit CobN [Candidatus Bathyarchaeia archaeon]|jgi:cobaltochelatase CobN